MNLWTINRDYRLTDREILYKKQKMEHEIVTR